MRLLKLVPDNTNIGFLRWRNVAVGISVLMIIASFALVAIRGLNFGVDFSGGLMMEVRFEQEARIEELRRTVNSAGAGSASIQTFGDANTVSIRLPLPPGDEAAVQRVVTRVQDAVRAGNPDASFRRTETVSGKVSGELVTAGALAILFAMIGISVYIWFRFEWQFGVGALFALLHDVALTLGFFAVTQYEFDLNIVAAVLTIVGYSLNDTIVVYDRVRENLRKYRKMGMAELLDLSLNETLPRTIVTSLTMIIALATLVAFGGSVLFGFSVAMLLGIGVGTYSSIFIAAPILIWLGVGPGSFLPTESGGEGRLKPKTRSERIGG
ncbi:protein-export membrane protein SecF [Polymorphobacter multimanifer]|uniref:Protein-export membrane protein SecF n=1 Tax=Polymorphobacter multimanifer TaxID=1070431 RepID=A0A841LG57_9SPHN|nr:protein translocase subunit SecF [Polymorphobacter multimanifer]MBB6228785.1 preprotein translocase subunit SecF [Polymorphobacter multimanifer]GGI73377.1 protein-export membrane protein SecF [Polymorphobacter multimanifer]